MSELDEMLEAEERADRQKHDDKVKELEEERFCPACESVKVGCCKDFYEE